MKIATKPLKLSKWGNAYGVRIPIEAIKKLGLKENSLLDIKTQGKDKIILKKRLEADKADTSAP